MPLLHGAADSGILRTCKPGVKSIRPIIDLVGNARQSVRHVTVPTRRVIDSIDSFYLRSHAINKSGNLNLIGIVKNNHGGNADACSRSRQFPNAKILLRGNGAVSIFRVHLFSFFAANANNRCAIIRFATPTEPWRAVHQTLLLERIPLSPGAAAEPAGGVTFV